jgi:hypothetical protein
MNTETPLDTVEQTRDRSGSMLLGATAVAIAVAVAFIYAPAAGGYFFNDDFQWLQSAYRFEPARFFHLGNYDHFYRPVIETYFYLGYRAFGCDARGFHLLSIGIHLLVIGAVYLFSRTLTKNRAIAALSAALFAVLPGFADAVAWVGAITDQLPALWYVLTLWLFLLYLQGRGRWCYGLALLTYVTCLLTHETSATLPVMMVALEVTVLWEQRRWPPARDLARRAARYLPFALLMAGYLAIEYVVNSRSYVVTEGHYRLGWHAIPNTLDYIVWLYVGKRTLLSYVAIVSAGLALVVFGSPRVRFYVAWILINLAPVAFFTWGNAGRYLYTPAVGFVMLLAEGVVAGHLLLERRLPRRVALAVTLVVVIGLSARFGTFAAKGAARFAERTEPYRAYVQEIRARNQNPKPFDTVEVSAAAAKPIPELYREVAAQAAFCMDNLRVTIR